MNYFIDLFCGAGGVTTGVSMARKADSASAAKVIACVNHDSNAILSHQANHPKTVHYTEDILVLDLTGIAAMVAEIRANDPGAMIHLWASLECTNFSKAKGGLPREADSRTLAHGLYRYVEALSPDRIWIENVREFMSWGPLDDRGKPVSRMNGRDYVRWCNKMQGYGYDFDWRLLCCADYGDYTSRTRYFAQFARKGLEIRWPAPTHAKKKGGAMFDQLKPWRQVREVLDLDDHGASIFERKKPLVEKTLKRIYAGLQKFVGDDFIMQYYSGKPAGKVKTINNPGPTLTSSCNQALVRPITIQCLGKNNRTRSVDDPFYTIVPTPHEQLVTPVLMQYNGKAGNGNSMHSVDKPACTLTGTDRLGLLQFIQMNYTSGSPCASVDDPARTLTANPKHRLATVQYLLNPQYENKGASIEDPCFTLIARTDKRPPHLVTSQFVLDTHFGNNGKGIDEPAFTLTASRHHPYLVTCEQGHAYIVIYDDDSETMKQIKTFMAAHGIIDIKMRMLKIGEMKKITGLPVDYVLIGTDTEKKKFIGNAVPTYVVKAMVEAYN